MDAILNQMIAFDDQAARFVKNAEATAAGILEKARHDVEALEKKLESDCRAEVDALIRAQVEAVEKNCAREMETETIHLLEEHKRLLERVPALAHAIAEILAYPGTPAPAP